MKLNLKYCKQNTHAKIYEQNTIYYNNSHTNNKGKKH